MKYLYYKKNEKIFLLILLTIICTCQFAQDPLNKGNKYDYIGEKNNNYLIKFREFFKNGSLSYESTVDEIISYGINNNLFSELELGSEGEKVIIILMQ